VINYLVLLAWHLSGGSGWCANSANKRVLVRGADGHEAVHEVKRDLGLRGNDVDGMEGYGGVDTSKGQTVRAVRGAAAQRLQAQYRLVQLL
jgi:hypothetical protein